MDAITRVLEEMQSEHIDLICKYNEPLKNHTTFKIGGEVRVMFFPQTATAVTQLCECLYRHNVTPLVVGNGSNMLASDSKHEIVVINTKDLNKISKTGEFEITAEAGALLSKIAMFARDNELSGIEFAHGIPGTLGGAVVMNAGAYGGEMKDVVIKTVAYSAENGMYTLSADEHAFNYRHSYFYDNNDIILSSVLELQKSNKDDIIKRMQKLGDARNEKQPLDLPSAGSTFKRPKEDYAAALIDRAGLKGFAIGGAKVSEKHAGFIVNYNNATFDEVIAVVEYVQEIVYKKNGIILELEVKVVK